MAITFHGSKTGLLRMAVGGLVISLCATVVLVSPPTGCSRSSVDKIRAKAEQGDVKSQVRLGLMYSNGAGLRKDPAEALKWFRRAAEQGNAEAECNLGLLYLVGNQVPKDAVEAYKWLSLSASQGDEFAATALKSLKQHMTPQQIIEGEQRTAAFVPDHEARPNRP